VEELVRNKIKVEDGKIKDLSGGIRKPGNMQEQETDYKNDD
jgi:hypothetical protein